MSARAPYRTVRDRSPMGSGSYLRAENANVASARKQQTIESEDSALYVPLSATALVTAWVACGHRLAGWVERRAAATENSTAWLRVALARLYLEN